MIDLSEKPEWFDSRRFVSDRPEREYDYEGWSVRDLATNIVLVKNVTGEEAGLYADALETKYNRYLPKGGS